MSLNSCLHSFWNNVKKTSILKGVAWRSMWRNVTKSACWCKGKYLIINWCYVESDCGTSLPSYVLVVMRTKKGDSNSRLEQLIISDSKLINVHERSWGKRNRVHVRAVPQRFWLRPVWWRSAPQELVVRRCVVLDWDSPRFAEMLRSDWRFLRTWLYSK